MLSKVLCKRCSLAWNGKDILTNTSSHSSLLDCYTSLAEAISFRRTSSSSASAVLIKAKRSRNYMARLENIQCISQCIAHSCSYLYATRPICKSIGLTYMVWCHTDKCKCVIHQHSVTVMSITSTYNVVMALHRSGTIQISASVWSIDIMSQSCQSPQQWTFLPADPVLPFLWDRQTLS